MSRRVALALAIVTAALGPALRTPDLAAQARSSDWPQFRGPNRDGTIAAYTAPARWPEQLTERWRVEVGEGYATPVLVGDRVYTFTRQGADEVMRALDAATGKTVWESRYAAPVQVAPAAKAHGPGPKSTPTFADGRLFTLGMGGIVTAFDAASGRRIWQRPADPVLPLYGTAASPLVSDGVVIVHVGGHDNGALTAFDPQSGEVKWRWDGDGPSYASARVAGIDGVRQVITLAQERIIGVSAATGELLWERPFTTPYTQNIITPVLLDGMAIVSGFQRPVEAFRIARREGRWATEDVWKNEEASFYMADPVVVGGTLFGLSQRNRGQYVLIDVKSGATVWTGMPRQAENAAIVHAGELVFALEDDGELVVGRVDGGRFEELRRYKVSEGRTWAQPVISGNRIYVKDDSTLALWTIE